MGNTFTSCFQPGDTVSTPDNEVQLDRYASNIGTMPSKNQPPSTLVNQSMPFLDLRAQLTHEQVPTKLSESAGKGLQTLTEAPATSDGMGAFESTSKDLKKVETITEVPGISNDMHAFESNKQDTKKVPSAVGLREELHSVVTGSSSLNSYGSIRKETTGILIEKSIGVSVNNAEDDREIVVSHSVGNRVARASNRSHQIDNLRDMEIHQVASEESDKYPSRFVQEMVDHFEYQLRKIPASEEEQKIRSVQDMIALFESMEAKSPQEDEKKDCAESHGETPIEDTLFEVDLESDDSASSVAPGIKIYSREEFRLVASPTHINLLVM